MVPITELKLPTLPQCVSRTVTENARILTLDGYTDVWKAPGPKHTGASQMGTTPKLQW